MMSWVFSTSVLLLICHIALSYPVKIILLRHRDTKLIRTSNTILAEISNATTTTTDNQAYNYVRDTENRIRSEVVRSVDDIKVLLRDLKDESRMQIRELKDESRMQMSNLDSKFDKKI